MRKPAPLERVRHPQKRPAEANAARLLEKTKPVKETFRQLMRRMVFWVCPEILRLDDLKRENEELHRSNRALSEGINTALETLHGPKKSAQGAHANEQKRAGYVPGAH